MRWLGLGRVCPLVLLIGLIGCSRTTARLTPEMTQRLDSEGILRRADDEWFRYTHGIGTRRAGWEEMMASIILTRRTLLIHQNDRTLIEIMPGSFGDYRIRRDHDRLILRMEGKGSSKSWSFRPPSDPEGWAEDIRGLLKAVAQATG